MPAGLVAVGASAVGFSELHGFSPDALLCHRPEEPPADGGGMDYQQVSTQLAVGISAEFGTDGWSEILLLV